MIYPGLKKVEKYFGILGFLMNMSAAAYGIIIPLIILEILQSEQMVGYYYSALSAGGLLINILSAMIFSKFPKIKIFKFNILIAFSILIFMTLLQESFAFVFVNFARVLAMSIIGTAITLMIREVAMGENAKIVEIFYSRTTRIGSMIGGLIGGYAATYFGNEIVFIISGSIFFIMFLIFGHMSIYHDLEYYELVRPKKPKHIAENKERKDSVKKKPGFLAPYKEYFKNTQNIYAYILGIFGGMLDNIQGVYMPLIVMSLQYNQNTIANVKFGWALFGFLMLAEKIRFAKKHGYKKTFRFANALVAIFFAVVGLLIQHELAVVLFFFFVLMDYPNHLGNGNRRFFFYAANKGIVDKCIGAYSTSYRIGAILGPIVASFLFSISVNYFGDDTYATLFKMIAALFIIPAIVSFFIKDIKNKPKKVIKKKLKKT